MQSGRIHYRNYQEIRYIGNADLLMPPLLAFFCSVKAPGDIILKTFEYAKKLRKEGVTVISGFHSPLEQECLRILLKGTPPVILCPARSIETMRIPSDWKPHLENNRLLILSPFPEDLNRITVQTSLRRNHFITSIADHIFVAYADPDSKTEKLCHQLVAEGKNLLTIPSSYNDQLFAIGAKTIFDFGLEKETREKKS